MTTGAGARRRVNGILVVLFLCIIALPVGAMLAGYRSNMADTEQRTLAAFPKWSWSGDDLTAFPVAFQAFFDDRFPLRDRLIRAHNQIKFSWLGSSPSQDVIRGRDGWLFLGYPTSVNNYLRRNLLSEARLNQATQILEARQDWLRRRGAQYLFVVVPDKYSIYPEQVPFAPADRRIPSRLDQLIDHLAEHSDFRIVDLRSALLQEKPNQPLYYKTNTHWNAEGGYVGYREIMRRAGALLPSLPAPLPRGDFQARPLLPKVQDLAKMLGMDASLKEAGHALDRIGGACAQRHEISSSGVEKLPEYRRPFNTTCNDRGLPRMVMFRDSFATELVPFLSEHFQHAIFEWRRFDRRMVDWLVSRQHPHLFIEEVAERDLMRAISAGRTAITLAR